MQKLSFMAALLLWGRPGPWELIIIGVLLLLFFGGKKIPELMKGLGKGVKSFKDGMNDNSEEEKSE